jgi:hypothetical protein
MPNLTNVAARSGPATERISDAACNRAASPLESMRHRLSAALSLSLVQLGFDPARIHTSIETPAGQSFDTGPGRRQFVVTFEDASVTIAPGAPAPNNGPGDPSAPASAAGGQDSIAALRESLLSAGIDPGTISGQEWTHPASRPERAGTAA